MSETHRAGRFSGVERADSLTWNPHKLMGVLLQCSTLHLKGGHQSHRTRMRSSIVKASSLQMSHQYKAA